MDSSIGEAGDAMAVVETDLNSTCQGVALSAPVSEQSTGKDDPEAPGWTKRYICTALALLHLICALIVPPCACHVLKHLSEKNHTKI